MTPEQAVEVILAADAWDMCPKCLGACFQVHMDAENMMVADPTLCLDCKGTGCQLKPEYRKACRVLKRRPPRAKVGQWAASERRMLAVSEEFKHIAKSLPAALGLPAAVLGLVDPDEEPESSPFR
jgi:hypothetical protein